MTANNERSIFVEITRRLARLFVTSGERVAEQAILAQIDWLKKRRKQIAQEATEWIVMSITIKEIDNQIKELEGELQVFC